MTARGTKGKAGAAEAAPAGPTTLEITVPGGGKVRPSRDLPISAITAICKEHETNFQLLLMAPLQADDSAAALEALYRACCAHVEVEPPAVVNYDVLYEAVLFVPSDAPTAFRDGLPTTGAPETT